jgi:hypothetical protein
MSEYGQINQSTKRWELIQKIIKNNKFKTIVEIGTWKGLGSTLAVLESIGDDTKFITLETDYNFYTIAKDNLKKFENKFDLLYGKIINSSDVIDFIKNYDLSNEQTSWLSGDMKNFDLCPNVIDLIPNDIDFLILDGGEFSTYSEWKILKDRTKFVALDDIKVLKCEKIYNELINDDEYSLIDLTDEGHGFCIFKKNGNNSVK